MPVSLITLNRMNWEPFSRLAVRHDQQEWMPTPVFCLAESAFESALRIGIVEGDNPVGIAIVLNHHTSEPWISRIMVDRHFQHRRIGSTALTLIMTTMLKHALSIRTSVHERNLVGKALFLNAGFDFNRIPGDPEEIGIFRR